MSSTDEDWKKALTKEQYRVLRQKGTDAPFAGELLNNEDDGLYVCAGCGLELFASQHKFDSGSGWPSFYDVVDSKAVKLVKDMSGGMERVEVTCAKCCGHLGHVFNDAPTQPTGMRFCINDTALNFNPKT